MRRPPLIDRVRRATRRSGYGLIGAGTWVAVSAVAVLLFATEHEPIGSFSGYLDGLGEHIGFASGFAVSGAACGSVLVGLFGRGRWAIVMGGLLIAWLLLGSTLAIAGYPRLAVARFGVSPVSAENLRRGLVAKVRIGLCLGAASGLVVSGIAACSGWALRRIAGRGPRLAALVAILVVAVSAIPAATFRLSELARRVGLEVWGDDFQGIMGASVGSTTGAFAGLLVALLLVRGGGSSGLANIRAGPGHEDRSR